MSDHPSTFSGKDMSSGKIEWGDGASLHLANDGAGVFDAAKALRRATLGELVRYVMMLPDAERRRYTIQKSGDHRLCYSEIAALAARDDYPG
ncbi:hypothetical protein [Altererythrobacter sp.]|uniref:hypothetical protein n=1 Tax=Altererythrobacter sp. TaxID=1872480 RepID=UPI003D013DD4